MKKTSSSVGNLSASTAAAVSAFAKSQISMLRPDPEGSNDENGTGKLKTMGSLSNYFIKDETKMRFLDNGGRRKQRRCKQCALSASRLWNVQVLHDMKNLEAVGFLDRLVCSESVRIWAMAHWIVQGGRGNALWELGGEGNRAGTLAQLKI